MIKLENEVILTLEQFAKKHGFEICQKAIDHQRGPDLVLKNTKGEKIVIEAKGNSGNPSDSRTSKEKFSLSDMKGHFGKEFFKLLSYIENKKYDFVFLAYPNTLASKELLEPIKAHLKYLGFSIILVGETEQETEFWGMDSIFI